MSHDRDSPEPPTPAAETYLAKTATSLARRVLPPVLQARREVARHNRQIVRIYEDLRSWVADEDHAFVERLVEIDNDLNERNLFFSGERTNQRREAKRAQLQRFRDRSRQSDREIENIEDSERFWHRFWRRHVLPKSKRRPIPANPHLNEIERALERWREPEEGGAGPVRIAEPP